MKNTLPIAQIFLRLALGIGFILPVMDRLGMLGLPGEPNVGWGNWSNFIDYTHSLLPYLNRSLAGIMGTIATIAEVVFGILLIIGFKTRLTAIGSFVLTLTFAVSMLLFAGYRAPFNYSVFTASAASLLLSTLTTYKWSIDDYLKK
ncbi:TQO small subunit DoxD [compost metagenome]